MTHPLEGSFEITSYQAGFDDSALIVKDNTAVVTGDLTFRGMTRPVMLQATFNGGYAGMAMGFTTPQYYRYVILPMAFRIVIPPLTSESMNLLKNSSVAFAVSIAELTMFAMQAQEETSRGIEVYLAVTGLYFVSAFAINRLALFIEIRVQVPGMIGGGK